MRPQIAFCGALAASAVASCTAIVGLPDLPAPPPTDAHVSKTPDAGLHADAADATVADAGHDAAQPDATVHDASTDVVSPADQRDAGSATSLTPLDLALGADHSCLLLAGTSNAGAAVYCWGSNQYGQLAAQLTDGGVHAGSAQPVEIMGLTPPIRAIAAGRYHTCVLGESGNVQCWGADSDGQLGQGVFDAGPITSPVPVRDMDAAEAIGGGLAADTRAILKDHRLFGWGDNQSGQLGTGTLDAAALPVESKDHSNFTQVSGGSDFACALMGSGSGTDTVRCWGNNDAGQIGPNGEAGLNLNATNVGLTTVMLFSTGADHTCAVVQDGGLFCWGSNSYDQVGASSKHSAVPIQIPNIPARVESVACGEYHTCVLEAAGGVQCFGANFADQLGVPTQNGDPTPTPRTVNLSGPATVLRAGGQHTCAILSTNEVYCWGNNDHGQLGSPTASREGGTATPVLVDPTWAH
jgi:alpha-tubulin suppressor-like RCC1 family protein